MPVTELLLCGGGGVKGKRFFLPTFPFAGRFLEGRVCWVRPRLVWEYSEGGNTVRAKPPATGEEQAMPAALLVPKEGGA